MEKIILEGWFIKSPPKNRITHSSSWRRRYFALVRHEKPLALKPIKKTSKKSQPFASLLYWYTDEEQRKGCKPIRIIQLTELCTVSAEVMPFLPEVYSHYLLTLRTPKRTLFMCAEDEEEKNMWFQAMTNILSSCRNKETLKNENARLRCVSATLPRRQTAYSSISRHDSGYPPSLISSRSGRHDTVSAAYYSEKSIGRTTSVTAQNIYDSPIRGTYTYLRKNFSSPAMLRRETKSLSSSNEIDEGRTKISLLDLHIYAPMCSNVAFNVGEVEVRTQTCIFKIKSCSLTTTEPFEA
ncbi:GRB2-associated-binding protein 3-like [Hydractinia symbiolongicarpus]|uniref:GRB2-associated-binding protein 3-like n=1 Tax=Hydractinia symbiolongicarpus TaxID=13093 RepID=UPI002550B953|nr:GRB2-associated-binding protein 3-like [Hydractinia symbiolongicarpus]